MNSTQIFIIALITTFLTALVPLIPFAIKLFFQANEQKLINAKLQIDKYKETISQLCIAAETLFKEGNGQIKYDWVVSEFSAGTHIPVNQLKGLIELVLSTTRKSLGEEWNKLSKTTIPLLEKRTERSSPTTQ